MGQIDKEKRQEIMTRWRTANKLHESLLDIRLSKLNEQERACAAYRSQIIAAFDKLKTYTLTGDECDDVKQQFLERVPLSTIGTGRRTQSLYYLKRAVKCYTDRVQTGFETRMVLGPRQIYKDLVLLETLATITGVEFDLKAKKVSVITDSITLRGVPLGRFSIELSTEHLTYQVIALEPNPAAECESHTHPHVSSKTLCEGENSSALETLLHVGDFFTYFASISEILHHYNEGRAYTELRDWYGDADDDTCSCAECDADMDYDDHWGCERCSASICYDCKVDCEICEGVFCLSCVTECSGCGEVVCENCIESCEICHAIRCKHCLTTCEECGRTMCGGCTSNSGDAICADCATARETEAEQLDNDIDDDEEQSDESESVAIAVAESND